MAIFFFPAIRCTQMFNITFRDNSTCGVITEIVTTTTHIVHPHDAPLRYDDGIYMIPSILLMVASVATLAAGYKIIRPLTAGVALVSAFALVYSFVNDEIACEWRLGISSVVSVCAMLLACFLMKAGIFAIGAAAFGISTHFVYDALPITWNDGMPMIGNQSLVYWISMAIGIIIGGILAHKGRKRIMMIVSSMIGAVGLSFSLSRLVEDDSVSSVVWFFVAVLACPCGVACQWYLDVREEARKKKPPAVPVGVPVQGQPV